MSIDLRDLTERELAYFERVSVKLVQRWRTEGTGPAYRNKADKVTALSPAAAPVTVEQLVQRHPALTLGGLRWMLFHRKTNGLQQSGAVIARGRRLYLDESRFLAWFASTDKPRTRNRRARRC